jgi:hypothetical protein
VKEYYYMYNSDYSVGGLYKSGLKLTEDDFKLYKEQMIEEICGDTLDADQKHEIKQKTSLWSLQYYYYSCIIGSKPSCPTSRDLKEKPVRAARMRKEHGKWCRDEELYFMKNPHRNFYLPDYLVRKGILIKVEYDEVYDFE